MFWLSYFCFLDGYLFNSFDNTHNLSGTKRHAWWRRNYSHVTLPHSCGVCCFTGEGAFPFLKFTSNPWPAQVNRSCLCPPAQILFHFLAAILTEILIALYSNNFKSFLTIHLPPRDLRPNQTSNFTQTLRQLLPRPNSGKNHESHFANKNSNCQGV